VRRRKARESPHADVEVLAFAAAKTGFCSRSTHQDRAEGHTGIILCARLPRQSTEAALDIHLDGGGENFPAQEYIPLVGR